VRISHRGCQHVDTGCGGKLPGFFRRSEGQTLRRLFMDFGTGSDFADLSLDQDLTRDALFCCASINAGDNCVNSETRNMKEMAQLKTSQRLRSSHFCLAFILVLLTSTVSYGDCFDDALAKVDGRILVMDSGAVYRITDAKGVEITFWLPSAEVTICDQVSISGEIYYSISNKDMNETVSAARERRGRVE
jgi:hypothetical protein